MSGGQVVKTFREERGMSQQDLATAMSMSMPWVTQVETGRIRSPRRGTLERLDGTLGAGGAILRAYGYMLDVDDKAARRTTPAPADLGDMLAEILSEIRTHRRSDIAPTARLADMPTSAELRAEVESLGTELRAELAAVVDAAVAGELGKPDGVIQRQIHQLSTTIDWVVKVLEERLPAPPDVAVRAVPSPPPSGRKRSSSRPGSRSAVGKR